MKVISSGHSFAYEMSCLTMLFFPGRKVALADELPESDYVYTQLTEHKDTIELIVQVNLSGTQYQDRETLEGGTTQWDCQRALGVLVYKLLSRITGRHPQWGILTGIRPVKLIQRRVDEGMPEEEIRRYFQQECLVSPEKMDLAMATQKIEHQILSRSTPDSFSLYISIPSCPSRCSFCSFAGSLRRRRKNVTVRFRSGASVSKKPTRGPAAMRTIKPGKAGVTSITTEKETNKEET